jgi:hypothetical protein
MRPEELVEKKNRVAKIAKAYAEYQEMFANLSEALKAYLRRHHDYPVSLIDSKPAALTLQFLNDHLVMSLSIIVYNDEEVYGKLDVERVGGKDCADHVIALYLGPDETIRESIYESKEDVRLIDRGLARSVLTLVLDAYLNLSRFKPMTKIQADGPFVTK